MFFGIKNSPATFQVIMNKILRDIINEGKVVAFVNNVLVGTEMEEGHDEIVEKVLRRLEENSMEFLLNCSLLYIQVYYLFSFILQAVY